MKQTMAENELSWTTWEELLLTCAVKRHGLKDWDSVAMELQNRATLPLLLTAQVCRTKYHDLKRRFMDHSDDEHDEINTIPWLEELRKLRVAELKQEVHRYDLSIQSLQLKVKSLEEERERSLKQNENDYGKPDLKKNLEEERSENDKKDGAGGPDGDFSDRDNRSFNESNSTENQGARVEEERREPELVEIREVKPDPASSDSKPADEHSYDGSSDAAVKPSQERKGRSSGDPVKLRDSAGELKESSDVQSSASLTRRRKTDVSGESRGGGDEPVVSPATREAVKSEPFVGLLDIIRSHKHGSMFERRLQCQKTDEYKNMVRHHVDLETILTSLNNGSYSSWTSKFYRDLLLLFTNAIVFFPKESIELNAAYELRDLVMEEMRKKRTQSSDSLPEPAPSKPKPKPDAERSDSLLAKLKPSAPIIVVCRKRTSISAKTAEKQIDKKSTLNPNPPVKNSPNVIEKQSPTRAKTKKRPVTGARSLRRNSNKNSQTITNPIPNNSLVDKGEAVKTDKKRTDVTVRKRGVTNFLKRIKRNSPRKGTLLDTLKSRGNDNNNGGRREQKKRVDGQKEAPVSNRGGRAGKQVKESSPLKRGVGRPPKKGREAGGTKRRREGGGAVAASKPAKKRARS